MTSVSNLSMTGSQYNLPDHKIKNEGPIPSGVGHGTRTRVVRDWEGDIA